MPILFVYLCVIMILQVAVGGHRGAAGDHAVLHVVEAHREDSEPAVLHLVDVKEQL